MRGIINIEGWQRRIQGQGNVFKDEGQTQSWDGSRDWWGVNKGMFDLL